VPFLMCGGIFASYRVAFTSARASTRCLHDGCWLGAIVLLLRLSRSHCRRCPGLPSWPYSDNRRMRPKLPRQPQMSVQEHADASVAVAASFKVRKCLPACIQVDGNRHPGTFGKLGRNVRNADNTATSRSNKRIALFAPIETRLDFIHRHLYKDI
jgi:hypothetical protein